jgi:hypothetical protein
MTHETMKLTALTSLSSNRWVRLTGCVALGLLGAALACAWHFHIWSWRDYEIYHAMSVECHPVWRDLHWGRVTLGQDVEEAIGATKPLRVERYGKFVSLGYEGGRGLPFTRVGIIAKDGKLAYGFAGSCAWNRTFFSQMTKGDWEAYTEAMRNIGGHCGPNSRSKIRREAVSCLFSSRNAFTEKN